jgi:hypothetical protein
MRERMKQNGVVRLAVGIAALLFSADALANNTVSVTANINFDTPLTLTKNNDINFGTVSTTPDTYTISTAGAVTNAGAGQWLYGTKQAGSITIAGSTTQTIAISVGSYVASSHVTLANPTCSYNAVAVTACTGAGLTAPGTGKTLLLGIDAAVATGVVAGTPETPSYTVTVIYG